MPSIVARVNLALVLGWASVSQAAVIEIEVPDLGAPRVPMARFQPWQGLPSKADLFQRAIDLTGDRRIRELPNATSLLHVAAATTPRPGAADFLQYQEYYWQEKSGATGMTGMVEEPVPETEIWPLVVIGVGLIAYQLRRQSRNRTGLVRFDRERA